MNANIFINDKKVTELKDRRILAYACRNFSYIYNVNNKQRRHNMTPDTAGLIVLAIIAILCPILDCFGDKIIGVILLPFALLVEYINDKFSK